MGRTARVSHDGAQAGSAVAPVEFAQSPSGHCHWSLQDARFTIDIDHRERRNALSPETYAAIKEGIIRAGAAPDVDVIVLRGVPGAFAVGGNLEIFLGLLERGPEHFRATFEAHYDEPLPFKAILACPKPVVAAVDGLCVAGGTLIAAVADITIATDRSTFGIPEARVGLADALSCAFLPPLIGLARTRYLTLTANSIDARTACDWGLIADVVAVDALDETVDGIVEALHRASPEARALYKRELNRAVAVPSAQMLMDSATGPDGLEGLSAFRDKRAPQWGRLP